MTETVRELMTDMEVGRRLESGEDALDLSIEKWEGIAQWVLAEMPICYDDFEAASCALCHLYLYGRERCGQCPYYLYFRDTCDSTGSHWDTFFTKRDYDTAVAMRDALKEIKENTNYEQ